MDQPAPRAPADVRHAIQELLRSGFIEEREKANLFQQVRIHRERIDAALDPLDLAVHLDTYRGVAIVCVRGGEGEDPGGDASDGWSHPLVRKQRLTLEQSLLVAILRGRYVMHEQEAGIGGTPAKVALDELLPQYLAYVGESGSQSRDETRLSQLLEQLKGYGIVGEIDANQEVAIRPLIAHLADPAALQALLDAMKAQAEPAAGDTQ